MFVPTDSIEWTFYDAAHYLIPDDPIGEEAFCVIRDAMRSTGTVAISRLVLYRRERAVMLKPHLKGIVLWTLRYGDEVRNPAEYFADIDGTALNPKVMNLVTKLIEERTKPWSPSMVRDPVQSRLLEIIASKKKGQQWPVSPKDEPEPSAGNVINIMDALRRSIASDKRGKSR